MEEEKVQEFDASMEERVEEPEYLSLEDVVQKTQAKAEIRSYPWYSVRKMAREIVVGGEEKTHLCIQERVFSISGFTGNKLRTTTDDDRAEKLALGCVNKDEHVYLRNANK